MKCIVDAIVKEAIPQINIYELDDLDFNTILMKTSLLFKDLFSEVMNSILTKIDDFILHSQHRANYEPRRIIERTLYTLNGPVPIPLFRTMSNELLLNFDKLLELPFSKVIFVNFLTPAAVLSECAMDLLARNYRKNHRTSNLTFALLNNHKLSIYLYLFLLPRNLPLLQDHICSILPTIIGHQVLHLLQLS